MAIFSEFFKIIISGFEPRVLSRGHNSLKKEVSCETSFFAMTVGYYALIPLQSFMYCLIAGTSVYLFTPSVVGMTRVGTLTISSF